MKIKKLRLKKFKRFDDLTIDLGDKPARIIALVGPNGCGKSSIFDAFEERARDFRGGGREPDDYYSKALFDIDPKERGKSYDKSQAVQFELVGGGQNFTRKSFHIRSCYRITTKLNVTSITAQPGILDDPNRPISSISADTRLRENYQRIIGANFGDWEGDESISNKESKDRLIGRINTILGNVLKLKISSLGNVMQGKGQLWFDKEDAKGFPYQNLSSGEKEVIDIVLDLVVRSTEFNDTIYCIDEPELHLNTAIQRKLLVEMERLIPENCQLWVATHSIGFLRALQDELATKCAVIDFSRNDIFMGSHTIEPMKPIRVNWQRIFETALDDLVGLLAPQRIIYCEGRAEPDVTGSEKGLDALIYNEIFESDDSKALFISSGGTNEVKKNGSLAIKVLNKAFREVELILLRDRDARSKEDRDKWLSEASHHRMLNRREIENYLLDYDVLVAFCGSKGRSIARPGYDSIVTNIETQDLKNDRAIPRIVELCGEKQMTNKVFLEKLAPYVCGTEAYLKLKDDIFTTSMSNGDAMQGNIAKK